MRLVFIWMFVGIGLFGQTATKSNWVLTFDDEFDSHDLDFTKWAPHSATGTAASNVPGAIDVTDGRARITARRENGKYTSGAISTYGTFAQMYGRFEVRLKVPQGQGLESRCRLLPVPSGWLPGIDVLRVVGRQPERQMFGNQWGDEKTERSYSGTWSLPAAGDQFHVIAVEWDTAKIVWFVDGRERFRSVDGIPHQPLYLELDLSVGGGDAKWPDSTTPFPATLDIDYVRAYKSGS